MDKGLNLKWYIGHTREYWATDSVALFVEAALYDYEASLSECVVGHISQARPEHLICHSHHVENQWGDDQITS